MKLALGVSLVSGFALVILYSIMVGVMIPKWQSSVDQLWNVAAEQTRDSMMEVINSTLAFIQFAARTIPHMGHRLPLNESGGYNPRPLLHLFTSFDQESAYHFGSMGFLKRAALGAGRLLNAKVSWQIAKDFRCPSPDYMYAFSDNAINPSFLGYCSAENLTTIPAYTGSDWGLKPAEVGLLDGTLYPTAPGAFLPVFDLFGAFTLTYEWRWVANNALTFAELDLSLLSAHIATNVDLLGGKGIAFIYESANGALIASTVNTSIFDTEHNRYTVENVTDQRIRDTADGQEPGWLITLTRRTEPGLNWTVVVAARDSTIKGNIRDGVTIASVASLGVLVALVLLTWVIIHVCVIRQLKAKQVSLGSIPYTVFDEVK